MITDYLIRLLQIKGYTFKSTAEIEIVNGSEVIHLVISEIYYLHYYNVIEA